MQLQSLNISGFKSFAKPTALTFAPGITAIVGPNGCGKSNVVDAIRWVLGEQRSSVLRSERMDNVIFNGTVTRKGSGFAEVKLVMDNSAGRLNVPYAEVEIARRLHRDGTSEYLLNNNDCRLKDISDMLHDSGMGPNLYTILELKMVEEILREDGEGRRSLFEEAAGVAKYKIRRRQAFMKLKQTDDDLLRLNDIVTEVERQVSSLKRQALRAKRYSELSAQTKSVEIVLAYRSYVRLLEELGPLESAIRETSVATEAAKAAIKREEARLIELRTTELAAEREATEARKSLSAVVAEISTMEAEEATLRAKNQAARDLIDRARREKIMLSEKREVLEERLRDLGRVRDGHLDELGDSEAALAKVEEQFRAAESALNEIEQLVSEHTAQLEESRRCLLERQKEHGQIIIHQAGLVSRRELLQRDCESLIQERTATQARLDALHKDRQQLDQEDSRVREDERGATSRIEMARSNLRELDDRSRQLAALVESGHAKLELLGTLEQKGPRSDKALTTLKDKHVNGLLHLLGDTIEVEDDYRRAFQAALGPAAYYYVTETTRSALEAIETLRREAAGQVTFVPLADFVSKSNTSVSAPSGAIGLASDLLRNGSAAGAVGALLNRVAIVKDWATALEMKEWARENEGMIVTLDGQWITGSGILRGGSEETRVPVDIGLGRQIVELRTKLDEAENEQTELQARTRHGRVELSGAEQALLAVQHQLEQIGARRSHIREQQVKFETMLAGIDQRYTAAQEQLGQLERELNDSRQGLGIAQKAVDEAEAAMISKGSSGSELTAKLAVAKAELDRRREAKHESERNRDGTRHRIDLDDADISRFQLTLTEIGESISQSERNAEEAATEISSLERRIQELESRLIDRFRQRDDLAQSADKITMQLDEIRNRIAEQDEKLRAQREAQSGELEGERRIELEIARLRGELDALVNNTATQQGLDLTAPDFAERHQTDLVADASPERLQELKVKIERLGPINLLAVEEYEQENARLDVMLKQRDDLLKAKQTLQETIARINETAQAHFLHTFEAVRSHFQRLFQEFFVAGEADLILSGSDLLEADITLWANPSGKRLKSLSLMSGGEKTMTAIALLFALYQVKPSPFCVFDEVDAPLDDANIDRFNRVIRMHSQHTQFILVTHNRRTMEIADNLYGVTMEEEGISKIVSVRLLSAAV